MTLESAPDCRDKMLFHITLNLRRDTTPEQVRDVLESVGKILSGHRKIEVGADSPSGSSELARTRSIWKSLFTFSPWTAIPRNYSRSCCLQFSDEIALAGTALALPTQASINYSLADQPHAASGAPARPRRDALKKNARSYAGEGTHLYGYPFDHSHPRPAGASSSSWE